MVQCEDQCVDSRTYLKAGQVLAPTCKPSARDTKTDDPMQPGGLD